MDIQALWEKALKKTEIIRSRVHPLEVAGATHLPYIFLAESAVNIGDTVMRSGEVQVEKPAIILPSHMPYFEGFDSGEEADWNADKVVNFFLVRGIKFPNFKYNNKGQSLEIFEGGLKDNIRHHLSKLEQQENLSTGLLIGPEDCWQFSLLIFIGGLVMRQVDSDIRKIWDKFQEGDK